MAWKKGQSGNPSGRTVEENRPFLAALHRAIKQSEGKKLRDAADKLLDAAVSGEPWALKELADRTDGRPIQPIAQSGDLNLTINVKTF